ncbi:hypothetical protein GCM10007415_14170 [Parapedobacter pyrenivorans]|uniref:Tetratricopeptide repeat-containing protein n=1 Tax=Parapedobacter pyrenivorans TaxID=1305674 RepID=A0A917HKB4_9SPHI|nr:hypothetical protein [Parapedobacter pyrenivorans]GGG82449.1 hypothetical protein GCM10007415_14170 [Parapedobacter pyrenivorans]
MDEKPSYELSQEELAYISQYLNGELGAIEQAAFEQRLHTDPTWQQKVSEVKTLRVGVREANLVDQLNEWHEEVRSTNGGEAKARWLHRRWWVAASMAAAVLLGVWWGVFSEQSDEQLYQAYFVQDTGLPVAMSGTDTSHYMFYDGMIDYKEGKYADALAKWAPLAQAGEMTDTLRYFSGMAYMGLEQTELAIEQLFPVASNRLSACYEEAVWYLALCYLRQGNRETAVALLKRIDGNEHAAELLKKLE